jgi:uncharacterized protein YecE (DUF72 family)
MGLLNIGTSSFTASRWERSFCPTGTKSTDFLRYYATRFNIVEIDSTFYGIPGSATVQGWGSKILDNFVFAAKVPQVITHETIVDRRQELSEWAEVLGKVYKRHIQIFAYANNHYAGHSPATVEMFQDIWRTQVKEEPKRPGPLLLFPMH